MTSNMEKSDPHLPVENVTLRCHTDTEYEMEVYDVISPHDKNSEHEDLVDMENAKNVSPERNTDDLSLTIGTEECKWPSWITGEGRVTRRELLEDAIYLCLQISLTLEKILSGVSKTWEDFAGDLIKKLREMADDLDELYFGTDVATLAGSSAGIVGGGLGIASLSIALAPVTAGASVVLGLGIAGGVVGGAGAVTTITAAVTKLKQTKKRRTFLKERLEQYKTELSLMVKAIGKFQRMNEHCLDIRGIVMFDKCRLDSYLTSSTSTAHLKDTIKDLGSKYKQLDAFYEALSKRMKADSDANNSELFSDAEIEELGNMMDGFEAVHKQLMEMLNVDSNVSDSDAHTVKDAYVVTATTLGGGGRTAASIGKMAAFMIQRSTTGAAVVADDVASGAATTAATALRIGRGFAIAGLVFGVAGVVLDVVTIGITARDVHKGSKSELAKEIRTVADKLEEDLEIVKKEFEYSEK